MKLMKRTFLINCFITIALCMATIALLVVAKENANWHYGVVAIFTAIGVVLNSACGEDSSTKTNTNEK